MRTLDETPNLQWFNPHSECRMCGKRSNGILMSNRNESYGAHCNRCAEKRLKRSKEIRKMLAKEQSA